MTVVRNSQEKEEAESFKQLFLPYFLYLSMYLLLIFVRTYLLPGSGTKEVKFLSEKSNVQHTGQWIFKIGWKNMEILNVESGDSYVHRNSEISRFFIPDQCKYQVQTS